MANYVAIDTTLIAASGISIEEWTSANTNYLNNEITAPNRLFVDPNLLVQNNAPSDWVQTNSKFIAVRQSLLAIEEVHIINDPTYLNQMSAMVANKTAIRLSMEEMRNLGYDFDRPAYGKYMSVTITDNKVNPAILKNYNTQDNCFSFPFFYSIKQNNNVVNEKNCFFDFMTVRIDGDYTIAFTVTFESSLSKSYNYSQKPPNGAF
jgi:hypothetical protein